MVYELPRRSAAVTSEEHNRGQKRFLLLLLVLVASPCLASTTRHVGVGQAYATLQDALLAANASDTGDSIIVHPGTYRNDHGTIGVSNITIKGLDPRPVFDAEQDSTHIENQEGIIVVASTALNVTIDNLEFTGAVSDAQNGCGVRVMPEDSPGWVAIRNCTFHDNQMDIEACPDSLLVENCELGRTLPTYTNGFQHCMYVNQNVCRVLVFRYNYAHRPHNGHEIKSRAQNTFILYNRLADEDETGTYNIDIPDCGTAYIIGNVIVQGVNSPNESLIRYGAESGGVPGRDFYIINNTIVNRLGTGVFVNTDLSPGGVTGVSRNNIFYGPGTLYSDPSVITSSNNYVDTNLDNAPGFLDPAGDDYHLTAASPGGAIVDAGVDPGTSLEGYALAPAMQYVYDLTSETRPAVGALDIGAFEYPTATAISALLLSADAGANGVRLQWYAPGDQIASTSVYRRTSDTDWVLLGHPQADVGHQIIYEDRTVAPGRYEYRLAVRDVFGAESLVDTWVAVPEGDGVPRVTSLDAATPNPFGERLVLHYGLPVSSRVRLGVFDLQGRRVATVVDGVEPEGWHSAVWNGEDAAGHLVASGMYFARLEAAGGATRVRKIVVAR